jgi:hypothetical protein
MMKTVSISRLKRLAAALVVGLPAFAAQPALAADCYAIGQDIAASEGGEVIRAEPRESGDGRVVCVIVYTVQSPDGGRPQRKQIVVDQN